MGNIAQALTTIVDQLQVAIGTDVEVKEHPGRFTEDELGKILIKRKAVRIAIEGFPKIDVQGNGLRLAQVRFNAFVICADLKGEDRHKVALEITEQLAGLITYATWDDPVKFASVSPATVAIENLYSGDLSNGKGIAWWAISWTQAIRNH